jgi:hypothetical protein
MKATVLMLAVLCAGAAYAQTPPAPSPHAAETAQRMDDLATLLDLNEAQKEKVHQVLQEQHAKMKESFAHAKATGQQLDWKTVHQQMQQDTLTALSTVLSATQLKKFQIIQQQMHAHMGHHVGHGAEGAAATPPAQN